MCGVLVRSAVVKTGRIVILPQALPVPTYMRIQLAASSILSSSLSFFFFNHTRIQTMAAHF